jgi:prepilin-type N-terminal cleavage/methylation domain-containing protein
MRLRRYAAAAGRRLAAEGGYSLTELIVVLAILLVIVGALAQLFVSASTAQVDTTRRFEAQQNMRLALDKIRREIHCANTVTGAPGASIVISLGSYCPTYVPPIPAPPPPLPPMDVTWCTKDKGGLPTNPASPAANPPYSLWRYKGTTCSGPDGRREADYLRTGHVFTGYALPASGSLGKLSVDLPVSANPNDLKQRYVLKDDIVLRNTPRP